MKQKLSFTAWTVMDNETGEYFNHREESPFYLRRRDAQRVGYNPKYWTLVKVKITRLS